MLVPKGGYRNIHSYPASGTTTQVTPPRELPVHAYLAFDAEATASTIVYTAELRGSAGRLKRNAARMQVPADRVAEIKISPLNH